MPDADATCRCLRFGAFRTEPGEVEWGACWVIAPELEVRYQKIFVYLNDDITQNNPSVDLLLCRLLSIPDDRGRCRSRLTSASPLLYAMGC